MHFGFDDIFGRRFFEKTDNCILLPWVGSKRSLIGQISNYYPKTVNNYYEPFCGSLSVGLDVMNRFGKTGKSVAFNDYNSTLIDLYRSLSSDSSYDEMLDALNQLHDEFFKLTDESEKEQYYLERRKEFNQNLDKSGPRKSALFYFLIKAGFQQMSRFNSKGEFNTPYGRGKHFNLDYDKLEDFHRTFNGATFTSGDFESFIRSQNPGSGDFVYFDPPYDETFSGYTSASFGPRDQERLSDLVHELVSKGCYCLVSNNRTELIENLYSDFDIVDITRQNKFQRVGNNKEKTVTECLVVAKNINRKKLY